MATSSTDALTIALVHTTFNVLGILILYVPPWWRDVPVILAERLAGIAVKRPTAAIAYAIGLFIVLPLAAVAIAG